MIYVDASVALAQILAEDRAPPDAIWHEPLIASRLLEYEVWNRVNARNLVRSHGDEVRELLSRVNLVELAPPVLERAMAPFPKPVRTLDALHLASIEFLRDRGQRVELASYDKRMIETALALGVPILKHED